MEIKTELLEIVTKLQTRQISVADLLKSCPDGTLSFSKINGKTILIQEIRDGEKRKRHKLTREQDLIDALLRKAVLEDENSALKNDIAVLQNAIKRVVDYSANAEFLKLMKRYPFISQGVLESTFKGKKASSWASEAYNQSDYKPEEKRQITSQGLRVRSKSELLISEKLYEYQIPFRYEQVIEIDSIQLNPDFTIRRSDGKLFYWEHEGLTNSQKYLDWQLKKSQLYASVGIVPWDNLIVTYDNVEGIIDLRIVESEIKNKLLL